MKNRWMKQIGMQNVFRPKRKNRRVMMASIIGLGIGAAAYGIGKRQNNDMEKDMKNPLENFMNTVANQTKSLKMPNLAGIMEFSKELTQNSENKNNE